MDAAAHVARRRLSLHRRLRGPAVVRDASSSRRPRRTLGGHSFPAVSGCGAARS